VTYEERGKHEDAKWFENAIHGGNKPSQMVKTDLGLGEDSTVAARAARSVRRFAMLSLKRG